MKFMKVIGFMGLILCCVNGFADAPLKIGYVDVNEVFEAYDKTEGIAAIVKEMQEKGRTERLEKENKIREASKRLQEKGSSLGDKEKEKIRHEIEKEIEGLAKFDRVQREKEYEPVGKALTKIYGMVEKIGEKEKFDLIIEKRKGLFGRTVLFGKKSLDLTDKVIKALK